VKTPGHIAAAFALQVPEEQSVIEFSSTTLVAFQEVTGEGTPTKSRDLQIVDDSIAGGQDPVIGSVCIVPSRDRTFVRLAPHLFLLLQGQNGLEDMTDKAGDGFTHGRPSAGLDLASKMLYTQDVVHGHVLLRCVYLTVLLSGEYALLFSPFPHATSSPFYTILVTQPLIIHPCENHEE
jgi:hypothetical protein